MRKALAICLGAITAVVACFYSVAMGAFLFGLLRSGPPSVAGDQAIYRKFMDLYSVVGFLGLSLAAGSMVAALVIGRGRSRRGVVIMFWVLLAIVLPLSVANYMSGDFFVPRWQQAILDAILAFIGACALFFLLQVKPQEVAERVAHAFAMLFIAMYGVFVPGIYAILWFLNAEMAISLADTRDFTPGWISAAAAVGSLVVSVLTYRRSTPPAEPSRILVSSQ